jgi:hypothetical protein
MNSLINLKVGKVFQPRLKIHKPEKSLKNKFKILHGKKHYKSQKQIEM